MRLSDPSVSAQHASLRWTGEHWQLQDLGSRNGTFADGRRVLAGERYALAEGATIRFGNDPCLWQLQCAAPPGPAPVADRLPATLETGGPCCRMADLALRFAVSRNEEQVDIVLVHGEQCLPLRARAHHYLLLTLARARLEDAARDPGHEAAHGWVDQPELLSMLALDTQQLNLNIYRARKQIAEAGVVDPDNLIERRHSSRELRIGTANLEVEVL